MTKTKVLLLLLASLLASGCQSTTTSSPATASWNPLNRFRKPAAVRPTRIVAIWSHDILNTQGQLGTQGFGGRLYFYDAQNNTIPVDGQLTIHGYDDSDGPESADRFPDKKFVFTPEQLKQHHGKSELGSSYSIWIPWQALGGQQRRVSLVPTFRASDGTLLVGHQTQNLLPGPKPQIVAKPEKQMSPAGQGIYSQLDTAAQHPIISPTAFNQQTSAGTSGQPRTLNFTTTTINVPRSMSQQLRHPTGRMLPPANQLPNGNRLVPPSLNQPTTTDQVPLHPSGSHGSNHGGTRYRNTWTAPGSPLKSPTRRRSNQPQVTTEGPFQPPSQPTHSELYRHPAPTAATPQ